jgi:hypothetical protein
VPHSSGGVFRISHLPQITSAFGEGPLRHGVEGRVAGIAAQAVAFEHEVIVWDIGFDEKAGEGMGGAVTRPCGELDAIDVAFGDPCGAAVRGGGGVWALISDDGHGPSLPCGWAFCGLGT